MQEGASSENLALQFQELLTAIERLRCHRQEVDNAELFRSQVLQAIRLAEQNAKARGYADNDIKLATFAIVAFLDESILNLRKPVFNEWVRKPLQEELFGTHMAGEVFFQNLEKLLGRTDSHDLADLLEVYYLCLLLGFGGRYSMGGKGELRSTIEALSAKIQRIRGRSLELSPYWRIPEETIRAAGDPWLRKLLWGAAGCAVLGLLLFVIFKFSLGSGASDLRAIAAQIH